MPTNFNVVLPRKRWKRNKIEIYNALQRRVCLSLTPNNADGKNRMRVSGGASTHTPDCGKLMQLAEISRVGSMSKEKTQERIKESIVIFSD